MRNSLWYHNCLKKSNHGHPALDRLAEMLAHKLFRCRVEMFDIPMVEVEVEVVEAEVEAEAEAEEVHRAVGR